MEAKDTVMSGSRLHDLWIVLNISTEKIYKIAEAQAEISFKAGYLEGSKDTPKIVTDMILEEKFLAGYQAGIKEVVKWIKANAIFAYDNDREAWQAKLKEWGIANA